MAPKYLYFLPFFIHQDLPSAFLQVRACPRSSRDKMTSAHIPEDPAAPLDDMHASVSLWHSVTLFFCVKGAVSRYRMIFVRFAICLL